MKLIEYLTTNIIPRQQQIAGVKNIIAVASAKGGVGKSTTAVNMALALAQQGVRVGLLDADIYGPNQPWLLGILDEQRPEISDDKHFIPIQVHDVQLMSMALLVTEKTPMVWRGPMVSGALLQLIQQTRWQDVDCLIVDMPPGTGDIQLTLAQKVPVDGAVIITTAHPMAISDATKGIEMFNKVNIPILGIVENMSDLACPHCHQEIHLFKSSLRQGDTLLKTLEQDYDTLCLGKIPYLLPSSTTDSELPIMIAEPEGNVAQQYFEIVTSMAKQLWQLRENKITTPVFVQ